MRTSTSPRDAGRATEGRRAVAARSRTPEERLVVPLGHPAAHGPQGVEQQVEGGHDGAGVVVADARPDGGLAGGDPGHVPEAAGGQLEQGPVLLAEVGGERHQGGRREVGDVGHHGHEGVVLGRVEVDDVGPEVGSPRTEAGIGVGSVDGVGVSTHVAPTKSPAGALHADLLAAGHGVTADEAGWSTAATGGP